MSDGAGIRIAGVGKMYRLYASRFDTVLEGLGLSRLVPRRRVARPEFWALRGIDLEVRHGQRLGVIGRNGAGKSTLLKLITGNIDPTEGTVAVRGRVHALIDAGGGFHPEFTGRENIRAALTYQGLTPSEIGEAEAEIADFTELGEFLAQPFKTYSLGMQARLTFATATAIKPEILIIDEVLGAGDALFFSKAIERTRDLVASGASVIIVSHALDQIVRLCEEAVWLERGRIVKRGSSLEVVKAYEQFIRVLEDRRLRAKNRKVQQGAPHPDALTETLAIRVLVEGRAGTYCDVYEIELVRDGQTEERVFVGDAQDTDPSHPAFVVIEGGDWSVPQGGVTACSRRLAVSGNSASGTVAFSLPWIFEESSYEIMARVQAHGVDRLWLEVFRGGVLVDRYPLRASVEGGRESEPVLLGRLAAASKLPAGRPHAADTAQRDGHEPDASPMAGLRRQTRSESRWPGEGSILIEEVRLLGPEATEQAVFVVGTPMTLRIGLRARHPGAFEMVPVAVLYRVDGIRVSSHVGKAATVVVAEAERKSALLRLGPINLGNGRYVFSVAMYRSLDATAGSEVYDLLDRSYEFEVMGTPALEDGVFRHPGEWSFE
jgi:lipopolysaccharide transport system ATP-binding protein